MRGLGPDGASLGHRGRYREDAAGADDLRMKEVLLTGATGFMGRALADDLLRADPDLRLWALVRGTEACGPLERPEISSLAAHPRFRVLEGDVRLPGLGIDRVPGAPAVPEFDACFHLAAATEFREAQHGRTDSTQGPFRVLCSAEIRRNFLCVDDATRLTVAIAAAHPEAETIAHVANPATTNMQACSEAALECLEFESIALTPTIHGALCSEERMLARNLRLYGPYMTMQEPVLDLTNLRRIVGDAAVDSVAAPTPQLLRFLFGTHLRHWLDPQAIAWRRSASYPQIAPQRR